MIFLKTGETSIYVCLDRFVEPLSGPTNVQMKPRSSSGVEAQGGQWQRPTRLVISWQVPFVSEQFQMRMNTLENKEKHVSVPSMRSRFYVDFWEVKKLHIFFSEIQLPEKDLWGCDRVLYCKVYKQQSGQSGLSLWKQTTLHRVEMQQIDVFANYTMGVSFVNSAERESDATTTSFLGSK